jgi:hypothetical protein
LQNTTLEITLEKVLNASVNKDIHLSLPQSNLSNDQRKLLYIILSVTMLRFFSNIRFSFIVPYLEISPGIKLCKDHVDNIAFYWMLALFIGLNSGAFILGKFGEKKGILKLCKIIVLGTILPCLFLYCLGSNENHIINNSIALIGTRFINAFFHPVAFVVSSFFLMKICDDNHHTKISAYITIAAISGMQLSYFTVMYLAANNLQMWCNIFLGTSIFAGVLCIRYSKSFEQQTNKMKNLEIFKAKPSAMLLAISIGCVFNAGIRYHYFFVDTYLADILITQHDPALSYVFFYIALSVFLIIFGNIIKNEQQFKILTKALIGILSIGIAPVILPIHSLLNYLCYQVIFAFFLAGFLAPSLSVVFSLFKYNKTILHGTVWFTFGYSLSNIASDWLTEQYGFFTHFNFLPMIPLILGGFTCLSILTGAMNRLPNQETNRHK